MLPVVGEEREVSFTIMLSRKLVRGALTCMSPARNIPERTSFFLSLLPCLKPFDLVCQDAFCSCAHSKGRYVSVSVNCLQVSHTMINIPYRPSALWSKRDDWECEGRFRPRSLPGSQ